MKVYSLYIILLTISILPISFCQTFSYHKAVIKTCSGWQLNSLPKVKGFLENIAPLYPVEVVYCGGDPAIYFIDKEGEEKEVIPLAGFNEFYICNSIWKIW